MTQQYKIVITVGVRATVPIRNVEILENLGIKDKPAQQKVQASMAHVAASHLNRIVPQIGDCARVLISRLRRIRPG